MAEKMLFMLNPRAGRGLLKEHLLDVISLFSTKGFDVTVIPTRDSFRVADIVKSHRGQFDLVVCSGGDGTLNETITALLENGEPARLGYIPAGTTNDFAHTLGLSGNMLKDARNIAEGRGFLCDIGRFNDRYFTYVAAFGAFTDVAYNTSQYAKNIFGRGAYVLEGLRTLPEIRGYKARIEADGQAVEGEFLFGSVTNSTTVAGFQDLIPGVDLNDGLFEVLLVRKPTNLLDLSAAANYLLTAQPDGKNVILLRAAKVRVTPEGDVPWTLDGEYGGAPAVVEIENLPRAMEFIVPAHDEA